MQPDAAAKGWMRTQAVTSLRTRTRLLRLPLPYMIDVSSRLSVLAASHDRRRRRADVAMIELAASQRRPLGPGTCLSSGERGEYY